MDIRELDPRHEATARRHWEIGKAAEDASRPLDFYAAWDSTRRSYAEGREDVEMVLLGAFVGDEMWGAARVDHTLYDNLHSAMATYYVDPVRQREGIGRALAEASYDVSRRRGRRLMVTEGYAPIGQTSPGLLFGAAMGFTAAIEEGMKVVDLHETEPTWAGLAERNAPRHDDYTIVAWLDRLPEEYLDGYCRLNEVFFDEAPMGELDVENEKWDEERVRSREKRNARQGRHHVAAGALAPDGTLVALTEAWVDDNEPSRGHQSGTLVGPGHRGHGLGLAIKLANHRQLRAQFPDCRQLLTGTADVNAPMNVVNEALGYRDLERCVEMQRVI